jgi:FMN reductase [NAD(P)H]
MPNETIRLLLERGSVRNFQDRPIEAEVLKTVLEAGIQAPTGGNLQPYSIIRIEDPGRKRELAEMCGRQMFIADAPTDLLFCIDQRRLERWAELETAPFTSRFAFRIFWIAFQDTIICAQNVCTAADALGLGSVYIGTILESVPQARELLDLPEGVFPVVLLCLGYPKTPPPRKARLGVDVVVHEETYRELEDDALREAYGEKYKDLSLPVKEDRLDQLLKVCRNVGGEEFAERCRARVEKAGVINPAQFIYGLHYCADEMPLNNETFLQWVRDSGFGWFEKYDLPVQE